MSDEEQLLDAPSVYDFQNWRVFYRDTLEYHTTKFPDKLLIVDRIKTFRKFMSDRVVTYLGGLVREHPRYNTTQGWDAWVKDVEARLRLADATLPDSPQFVLKKFKSGQYTKGKLWQELDRLVEADYLSSIEQRQLFWDALSWDAQDAFVRISPYFDPGHAVWSNEEPDVVAEAEQTLVRAVNRVVLDEAVAVHRWHMFHAAWGFAALLLVVVGAAVWFVNWYGLYTAISIATLSCVIFLVMVLLITGGCFFYDYVKEYQALLENKSRFLAYNS